MAMTEAHKICSCGAILKPSTELCPACMNTGVTSDKWHVYRIAAKDSTHSGTKGGLVDACQSDGMHGGPAR